MRFAPRFQFAQRDTGSNCVRQCLTLKFTILEVYMRYVGLSEVSWLARVV